MSTSSCPCTSAIPLERELAQTTGELNKDNLFYSGAHGVALAMLKERALHEYRAKSGRRSVMPPSRASVRRGCTLSGADAAAVHSQA